MPKIKITLDGTKGIVQELIRGNDGRSELTGNLEKSIYARKEYVDNLILSLTGSSDGGETIITGSNIFGSSQSDIHEFNGSVLLNNGITGSLLGTSSFAFNSLTSSFASNALTSSFAFNSLTSSFASNANTINGLNINEIASLGNNIFIGEQTITGSLNIKGNINIASGSNIYHFGNKLFNYGQFKKHSTTISLIKYRNHSSF